MPRYVNHEDRRREITLATMQLLAEAGPRGVTVRAVAARMGGSSTIVTHYFRSRQALLDSLATEALALWEEQLAGLEAVGADPRTRLRILLQWLVPGNEQALTEERARINLLGEVGARARTQALFDAWDRSMRSLLRDHLKDLLAEDRVDEAVELLRALTNGISLSVVEHPDQWPKERQFAVLDQALGLLGLAAG